MTASPSVLSDISGGRVLDAGTGRGGFVEDLIAELRDYDEIIGVDVDSSLAEGFATRFAAHSRVRFQRADAMSLPFEDGSFDTVSVAGSLHHLADPAVGLREMRRVLRPGGHFIVLEMYRDGQTEAQMTHVMLHHWWAAVDQMRGTSHRVTYTRSEVIDMVNDLELAELRVTDEVSLDGNPKDPEQLASVEPAIETYLGYAAGHPELVARGEQLRQRLQTVGLHWSTALLAIGRKPG